MGKNPQVSQQQILNQNSCKTLFSEVGQLIVHIKTEILFGSLWLFACFKTAADWHLQNGRRSHRAHNTSCCRRPNRTPVCSLPLTFPPDFFAFCKSQTEHNGDDAKSEITYRRSNVTRRPGTSAELIASSWFPLHLCVLRFAFPPEVITESNCRKLSSILGAPQMEPQFLWVFFRNVCCWGF